MQKGLQLENHALFRLILKQGKKRTLILKLHPSEIDLKKIHLLPVINKMIIGREIHAALF